MGAVPAARRLLWLTVTGAVTMRMLGRMLTSWIAVLALALACAGPARGLSLQEMTRLAGQGES